MADLYTKMGKHEEAIEHYKKAVELDPTFAFSQRKIGTNLVFMGKFEQGREAYRKAMEMQTTTSGKLIDMTMVSQSYIYEGKHNKALAETKKILEMATKEGLPEWQAAAHGMMCDIYVNTGDLDNARQSVTECRRVVGASNLSTATKDDFDKESLFDEAMIAAKAKDFDKAMAKANEHKAKIESRNDPKEMEDHHALLGYIHFEKNEYAKSLEHLRQADQEDPYVIYHLAVAESKAGDRPKASELFSKVADWNESSLDYAFVRSKAQETVKMAKEAKE